MCVVLMNLNPWALEEYGFRSGAKSGKNPIYCWLNGDFNFSELNLLHSDLTMLRSDSDPTRTDTARYGSVRINESNRITDFNEKQSGAGQINAGVYLLRNSILKSFLKHDHWVWKRMFSKAYWSGIKLNAHRVNCPFLDIGTLKLYLG